MKTVIIAISLFLFANASAECTSAKTIQQTRECSAKEMEKMKKMLEHNVSEIAQKLLYFSGKKSAAEFLSIQKEWERLVQRQCEHQRALYGRGSIAGISYIECQTMFFKERIENLDDLYKELLFSK